MPSISWLADKANYQVAVSSYCSYFHLILIVASYSWHYFFRQKFVELTDKIIKIMIMFSSNTDMQTLNMAFQN